MQTLVCLHASKVDSDVTVVCKDLGVLILMSLGISKIEHNKWLYLKYDDQKSADFRKMCSNLGKTLSLSLLKQTP